MSDSKIRRGGWRLLKGLLYFLAGLLVLLGIQWGVFSHLASKRQAAVNAGWAAAKLPIADLLESYPVQDDSPVALALDASAQQLGLILMTADPEKAKALPERAKVWYEARVHFGDYTRGELERPGPEASAPPEAVSRFLADNAALLAQIRAGLSGEAPRWRLDLKKGFRSEIPNMIGHIDLSKILLADALAAHAAGRDAEALEDVEAVWKLSAGLAGRPELISQYVVISIRKMLVVALRKLDGAPPVWTERLKEWDPEKGMLDSHRFEAAVIGTVSGEENFGLVFGGSPPILDGPVQSAILRPYIRFCVAGTQELELDLVHRILEAGLCGTDEAVQKAAGMGDEEIPSWNIIARIALPNFGNGWVRLKYLRIQTELTQKVLDLKAQRASSGSWPSAPGGIEASVCPGARWTYSAPPEGGMSLSYSSPPPAKDRGTFTPTHEYKEAAPAAKGGRG